MAVTIERAKTPGARATFEVLVREYIASLPFSLDFQDVESELADLASSYGPPSGVALLGLLDGEASGCVGLRRLEDGIAELKRMYVRPPARGRGVGLLLCRAAVAEATALGYRAVRLDTTAEMRAAIGIYERLGFAPIAPYRNNPLPGARYFEARIAPRPTEQAQQ